MGWGDILMAMGDAKAVHEATGKRVVMPDNRVFSGNTYWGAAYECLEYIIRPDEVAADEDVYPFRNGIEITPYIDWPKSTKNKIHFVPYTPKPAELRFSLQVNQQLTNLKRKLGDFIFIEPNVKGSFSAKNKDWGFENFQKVVDEVEATFVQPSYGAALLRGVTPIKTSSFLDGAAVLSIAKTAVMSEGGLMHAAAAVNVPSAIIFGGFVSPENTGYEMHTNFFIGDEPCGSLGPCKHCQSAMKKINPRKVAKKLKQLFKS